MKRIVALLISLSLVLISIQAIAADEFLGDSAEPVSALVTAAGYPSIGAKGAVLINADTGKVIFEQNAYARLPMASTTKIMTALLLAEAGTPEKTIVTTKEMVTVEGSSMGLREGDTVSYRDLLYGLLLASGNDAANTVAICLGETLPGFADMMNAKASELGLKDTHFVTPSGLDNEDHYTTAYDLARLGAYAMKNEIFMAAASSKSATLNYGNPPFNRRLSNHNKLLSMYDGCVGMKTGFTKKSGRCLVSAAVRDGAKLVAVTLNASNDWNAHKSMLDYGFSMMKTVEMDTSLAEMSVPVTGGVTDRVDITIEPLALTMLPEESEGITRRAILPRFVYAPVEAGQTLGKLQYIKDDNIIAEVDITAAGSVSAIPVKELGSGDKLTYWFKTLISYK